MGLSELLLYGLFFAGFLLLNYVMQRAAARTRQEPETTSAPTEEADAEVWRIPAPGSPDAPPLERIPPVEPRATAPPARWARERGPALAGAPKRRSRGAALRLRLRSRHGLREAVIAMTVLGPCRSQAPAERSGETSVEPTSSRP